MNSSTVFQRTKKPFFFLKNRWIGKICYTPSLERPSELSRPIVFQNLAADLKDECIYFVIISTHMDLLPYLQPDPECSNPGWKNCRSKLHCSGAPWWWHLWKEGKEGRMLSWELPFPSVIQRNSFPQHLARCCSDAMAWDGREPGVVVHLVHSHPIHWCNLPHPPLSQTS